uniref:tRNA N(3)-cytidine methyltransferase n=1 Tax=Labrus bergylta TaxID=56723 RepID=A0A3Q3EHH5_9LABR
MAAPHAAAGVDGGCSETELIPSDSDPKDVKRPQFGTRFLTDPRQVFQHNAWDNVEWTEEQEASAKKKVSENSQPLPSEKQEEYDNRANEYWNDFYTIHENRFFKDRHWLFTEFPELAPQCSLNHESNPEAACTGDGQQDALAVEPTRGLAALFNCSFCFCSDAGLFVYCCDFSSTAVELVKTNPEYDPGRCLAFVHDLSDVEANYPVPDGALDVIVLIFVLSALHPSKMQASITRLVRLLKPGGVMLLRDYGRYDMAQLLRPQKVSSENFYVRGDGTRVYFFTQDELHEMFTEAGLEKVQNLVDRRLQVNRGKQLTMYRVWIQCKYRNPFHFMHVTCVDIRQT